MASDIRITVAVERVLAAMLTDADADHYGLELMKLTGLASGSLYPILLRLRKAGWVEARWEEIDPVAEGRPPRRYYRLTPEGVRNATRATAKRESRPARTETKLARVAW
ncbi:PadR family transcriptional regulator [Fodinicola acaciae]|uniref:PadR family transcriptional regulator n=1 Tax=Fodinicola acaciae TaxID=2681555 RepID=UPI0013D194E5|nr:helix-turn-helix transcriptional regulator [Fodinicola acaciae]